MYSLVWGAWGRWFKSSHPDLINDSNNEAVT